MISMRRHGDRTLSDERMLDIREVCKREGINIDELESGSCPRHVSEMILLIAHGLVQEYGIPLAEVARHVEVSTSAVSKMLRKAAI